MQSSEARRREVFHLDRVRSSQIPCHDITIANQCLAAYFEKVHPIIPVLHREAFHSLYQLYSQKALAIPAAAILDASSREGRAVMLICSVLALGALALKGGEVLEQPGCPIDGSQLSHLGLGLGFYGTCTSLSSYTHDNIETMLTYFFMVRIIHLLFIAGLTVFRESLQFTAQICEVKHIDKQD